MGRQWEADTQKEQQEQKEQEQGGGGEEHAAGGGPTMGRNGDGDGASGGQSTARQGKSTEQCAFLPGSARATNDVDPSTLSAPLTSPGADIFYEL